MKKTILLLSLVCIVMASCTVSRNGYGCRATQDQIGYHPLKAKSF